MTVRAASSSSSFGPQTAAPSDPAVTGEAAAAFMALVGPMIGSFPNGEPAVASSATTEQNVVATTSLVQPPVPQALVDATTSTPETATPAALGPDPKASDVVSDSQAPDGPAATTTSSAPQPDVAAAAPRAPEGAEPARSGRHGLSGLGTALKGLLGGGRVEQPDEPGWRSASRVRGAAGVVGTRSGRASDEAASQATRQVKTSEQAVKAAELSAVRLLSTSDLMGPVAPAADDSSTATDQGSVPASPTRITAGPDGSGAPVSTPPVSSHTPAASPTQHNAATDAVTHEAPFPDSLVDGLKSQTTIWAARLARSGDGSHRVTMHLHPGELGSLQVTVLVAAGQVDVTLAADSAGTRAALNHALHDLRQGLTDQGATVGQLDVRDLGTGAHAGHGSPHTSDPGHDRQDGRPAYSGGGFGPSDRHSTDPTGAARVRTLRTDVTVDITL